MITKHTNGGSLEVSDLLASAHLSALPESALRLLELAQDPENGPAEFAIPIEGDPGLHGQILKFVNSSYFGFSREISHVKMAITLVGVRTIKNFVLWSAVFSLVPNPTCGPFDLKTLWQDSLRRGLFARLLARQLRLRDAEEIFSAALLQDMAIPVLAKEEPGAYEELLERRRSEGRRLSDLETERFGWNHAQAGGELARIWKMPDSFATLIEGHTGTAEDAFEATRTPSMAVVALSALLPSGCDKAWTEADDFVTGLRHLQHAQLHDIRGMLIETDRQFVEFAPVLKLSTPSKFLAAWFDQSFPSEFQ